MVNRMLRKRRVFIAHKQERDALMRAVEIAGSLNELAKVLGISKQAVHHWKEERVPAEYIVDIELATGVQREELRPDLYRIEVKKKAAAPVKSSGQYRQRELA